MNKKTLSISLIRGQNSGVLVYGNLGRDSRERLKVWNSIIYYYYGTIIVQYTGVLIETQNNYDVVWSMIILPIFFSIFFIIIFFHNNFLFQWFWHSAKSPAQNYYNLLLIVITGSYCITYYDKLQHSTSRQATTGCLHGYELKCNSDISQWYFSIV